MNYPIYCINLKERLDRKRYVEKEFKKIDIQPSGVIFLDFHRHKKGGKYGCYDSHMKVWNDFYTNHPDKEMCIVFEDDFEVTENSSIFLKKATSFIEKNKDKVDILFLHDKFIKYNNNNNNANNKYFINGYGFLAHAYIVTRKYIKSIINNYKKLPKPTGINFDLEMNMNKNSILYSEHIYYCVKSIFNQKNDDISDNCLNTIDGMIRKNYGNNVIFNFAHQYIKSIKLLFNNDKATKKIVMLTQKLYCK